MEDASLSLTPIKRKLIISWIPTLEGILTKALPSHNPAARIAVIIEDTFRLCSIV